MVWNVAPLGVEWHSFKCFECSIHASWVITRTIITRFLSSTANSLITTAYCTCDIKTSNKPEWIGHDLRARELWSQGVARSSENYTCWLNVREVSSVPESNTCHAKKETIRWFKFVTKNSMKDRPSLKLKLSLLYLGEVGLECFWRGKWYDIPCRWLRLVSR